MSLPILLSIIPTVLFGVLAIVFSYKEERMKKLLRQKEAQYKQHLYQTTILKEIQDRIGYSLDIEKVTDVITASLDNLFYYSTASSMIIKNEKIIFKTHVREPVSQYFLNQLKQSMTNSLSALLSDPLPTSLDENITGIPIEETNLTRLQSFFHIPLIVNEKIVGLISIASTKPHLYQEQEMTILYKMTNIASTALTRLQNVLETEKGKLTSMIASLDDGVFMVDINSQITVINKAAKDFLALHKDQPSIIDVLSSLPNTYNFPEKIQQAMKENKKIEEKECKLNDKIFHLTITPVINANQSTATTIGAVVLLQDITFEKSLAQMKEDFTNIMVHELRSPLTAIKASAEFLTSQTQLSPEERNKMLRLMQIQSNRLLDQVAAILDAAKLEAGLFTVNKIPGDIKKLLQERYELFTPEAQYRNITLRLDVDPTLPVFAFDPIHVGQIINNLVSNSLKFTPNGGIITISAHRDGTSFSLAVSDTGPGIPKEKQGQLFSKFVQIQKANATVGTGLGLYIVKGITQAHGGNVSLESESGHGTTITITLPLNTIANTPALTNFTQPFPFTN
jgi:signal transduction histidine kinase